jgi:hypothetical protein
MLSDVTSYIVAAAVIVLGITCGIAAVRAIFSAAAIAKNLEWVETTLEEAVRQVLSGEDDEDAVIAGLQKIARFNAPEVRARVFPRIEELRKSSNANLAREAGWTHEAIVRQVILHRDRRVPGNSSSR